MDSFLMLRGFHLSALLLLTAPLLKVVSLQQCTAHRECCVPELLIEVEENKPPGQVISNITITKQPISILPQNGTQIVYVDGDTLRLSRSLDFEAMKSPVIAIILQCGPDKNKLTLHLVVTNVNDNSPTFPENKLDANISELFLVGEPWETVTAVDLDQDPIFYSLDNSTDGANFFFLKSENTPLIYLKKALDYEKEKMLTLILNCKETANSINISDSVNITVRIIDEDNKPPVFQPCRSLTDASFCLNAKYTGKIKQYQTESSPLSLQPHHILAVDGDTGINATILYQIVSDDHRAFWINASDGTLTMTRAINSSGLVTLTILAKQADDPYRYTMTSVTLIVLPVNRYPPEFPHSIYFGSVQAGSPKGSIVTKQGSSTLPLRVQAQDQDHPNKISPFLKYSLSPSDLFTITEFGLIFTKGNLTAAQSQYDMTVTAMDVEQGDNCSAIINLLVSSPDAPGTVTTTTRGPASTKPRTDPTFSGSVTGVPMSTVPPPAPPSVKTTTARGTGPSEPVTHTARTVSAHTSKNPPRTSGTTDGQPPGPRPTSTKPPVIGTTPNLGTSGAGPSSSKHPGPGPGVTTPPSVKTTTARGTGPSEPVTHTARTVSAHTSKNPPRTSGTTDGQPPGPRPTSTKPPVIGTTPNLGTSGAGPSSSKHPGPGPGVTTPPSVKTTTARGTGPSEPVTHTARTVSAHTSKNPPRTSGTTDGQPPGPRPTSTKPPVIGTTPNLGTSGAGPSSSKHPGPGPGVTNNQTRQLLLYDARHMAAVGVPLSLLLIICIIVIGILLRDGGWAKLKRRTAARLKSSPRQSHSSEGDPVQFTNQGFLVEEMLKSSLKTGQLPQESMPVVTASALDSVLEPAVDSSPGKLGAIGSRNNPGDDCDGNSLEEVTTDGEVKSILTKERKAAEGYKAVWFKEDIEPQANEERVIECPEDDDEGKDGSDNDDGGFFSNL
ncbi:cadherin-related family member 5 [Hypanus sabinus]|uniref:cadherin-related family member 5 n=1 Tax=Hypanus sabinus TaxID=79690 RepID=UPI0028C3995B|nr:cadherin-related family member 5 [Hypanus sabinus]